LLEVRLVAAAFEEERQKQKSGSGAAALQMGIYLSELYSNV
jgi:hypothetical protein